MPFTQIHAFGLARLDDLQVRRVFILLGAFLGHALPAEALPLERSVSVGVGAERAGVDEEGRERERERLA